MKLQDKFWTTDCNGCPHFAQERRADRIHALTGDSRGLYCLVGAAPKALVPPIFQARGCPCDHLPFPGPALTRLRAQEVALDLSPVLSAPAGEGSA